MSRLYDALKEASRFRPSDDRHDRQGLWEAWGIRGIDIPPVQNGFAELEKESEVSQPDDSEPTSPEPEEVILPPSSTPLNGSLGTSVHAALDKRARLIPHAMDSIVVEHYRRLRTKILQKQEEKPFRSLVVTSANPQEGKTVTVLNLGLSFAMLPNFRVLVVDGDLRRGSLGNWLGVEGGRAGLSNLIDGSAKLEDVILKSDAIPMHFIVRGNSQVSDMQTFQLTNHFQKMTEDFDLVLVDSPPVNLITDVQVLAGSCEAVLLIARAFSTTRKALEKAAQDLVPFRVIGTVLNAGIPDGAGRYYHGYY